jgi:phage shock protein PspC (stress-responsive transcriptional regulator)
MVRVLWVAGCFFYGAAVLLYIILMIALPEEPDLEGEHKPPAKKKKA